MIYIELDRESKDSLGKQLYIQIRTRILNGELAGNDRLPSTRELARELQIARNVVIESYEQLLAEGYVYASGGSGTYVSEGLQFPLIPHSCEGKRKGEGEMQSRISFRTGVPELSMIPMRQWTQTYKECTQSMNVGEMDYQDPVGNVYLRRQLCEYLKRVRGVRTDVEHIVITSGAAQAFSLLCGLVAAEDFVVVENPLSKGILQTLLHHKVRIQTAPVDESGIDTSKLPEDRPKLVFTTPSHQFPTGVILPIGRRLDLIRYARDQESYIVEDDYDSEFRFEGSPIQSMQQLDPERVIYVGTFSKTLMPSIRIGYMVLPTLLMDKVKQMKYVADIHSSGLEQITLARFLEQGSFERHICKMKKHYVKKRDYLVCKLNQMFGEKICIRGTQAGMHLLVTFKNITFTDVILNEIKEAGVELVTVMEHVYQKEDGLNWNQSLWDHSLLFGYGNTKLEEIDQGVTLLADILSR